MKWKLEEQPGNVAIDQLRKGHTDDKRRLDPEPEFLPSTQTSPDNETSPDCVPDENKSASPRRDPC
ncbi:hypothetical protein V5799_021737, partial [Amblyomma americanum]